MKLTGRVWKFGDNVDTDQIIPAVYLTTGDPRELGRHAFEFARPDFVKKIKRGDIIVAGKNFGSGSSREHAPRALMGAGVSCVIAKSFARIFFRNSVNIGLPLIEASIECEEGDVLVVDLSKGTIKNKRTGEVIGFQNFPEFLMQLMKKGLVNYTKEHLKRRK